MIAVRVEDGYGDAVVLTVAGDAAVVDVDRTSAGRLGDVVLDAADLRDLARAALVVATMLDEVTS